MKISYLRRAAAALLLLPALLTGCGGPAMPKLAEGAEPYAIPPMAEARFHEDRALDCGSLRFDDSAMAEGYVAVQAESASRLKFQVSCGDMNYNYDLPGDGRGYVIPLNMGSGEYTFRLMENAGGNKYACLWLDTRSVVQEDEFRCYLRPSIMVSYDGDSTCVAKARELAANCATDADAVQAIYAYLVKKISYDREKAATVQPGYLPDPDETLATGKGICFDYASLAAAMMRSLGIPCKLVTGYVDSSLYHAWNTFYIKEQGWVTVEIKATPNIWQRVDITFAASGSRTSELTDDSKYTTRFTY